MDEIDKREGIDEEVFSYRATKDRKVVLIWYGTHIKTLKGSVVRKFLHDSINVDQKGAQLVMANITGNFKCGNER